MSKPLGDSADPSRSESTINTEVDYTIPSSQRSKAISLPNQTFKPDLQEKVEDTVQGVILGHIMEILPDDRLKVFGTDHRVYEAYIQNRKKDDAIFIGDKVSIMPHEGTYVTFSSFRKKPNESVTFLGNINESILTWTDEKNEIRDLDTFWEYDGGEIKITERAWLQLNLDIKLQPTTTTTLPPCSGVCEFEWLSPGDTQWTQTSSTCSDGCKCLYPVICGEYGDKIKTDCIDEDYVDVPPYCGGTSTPAPCTKPTECTNCTWYVGVPSMGNIILENNCVSTTPGYQCSCPEPGGTHYCEEVVVTCSYYVCAGECEYIWIDYYEDWYPLPGGMRCSFFQDNSCDCPKPTRTGYDCEIVKSPCLGTPCHTSTTTPEPCEDHCIFRWLDEFDLYFNVYDPCLDSCPCVNPSDPDPEDKELFITECGTGTTTTTTSTTTTTLPPTGVCCNCPADSCTESMTEAACESCGGVWRDDYETCDECFPPTGRCCFADGTCAVTLEDECASGCWQEGEDCVDDSECELSLCCCGDTCYFRTKCQCELDGCTFYTGYEGYDCGDVSCPTTTTTTTTTTTPCPTGACCTDLLDSIDIDEPQFGIMQKACNITTQAGCPSPGIWIPCGTCSPNPCP